MRGWRVWLRSVRGQLALFGITFVAAVVLAVTIVCLRDVLFERYVRETYPPTETWAQDVARELAVPEIPEARLEAIRAAVVERESEARRSQKPAPDLEQLYGYWQLNPDCDPSGLLAMRLTQFAPDWVIDRLRRTLAAGNPDQRARALRWMAVIVDREETAERVRALATQAQRRTATRGEETLRLQAESVLASGRVANGR